MAANSTETLALELGHNVTNYRKNSSLPGNPEFCDYNGKKMRVSEARARMIAELERTKVCRIMDRSAERTYD